MAEMRVAAGRRRLELRRPVRAAMLVATALFLPSCATGASGPGETAPANAGQLKITQLRVGDAIPIEGAYSYIRIERATGAALTERRLAFSNRLMLRVPPGAYRLMSWQRTCDGNCGYLDPPSNRCAVPFKLRPGEEVEVEIRVNFDSGCVIVLHHANPTGNATH
jgi:hypothetical protein